MRKRRTFLAGLILLGFLSGLAGDSMPAQSTAIKNPPQKPLSGQEPQDPDNPALPNPEKKILESNDKDMKKKVEQLYQLASELKEEVEKTDSSKVLSLNLVKKAEEIEKLAHDIKNRSKG
jgi:hypothetical protein